jgi:hypothetical protein
VRARVMATDQAGGSCQANTFVCLPLATQGAAADDNGEPSAGGPGLVVDLPPLRYERTWKGALPPLTLTPEAVQVGSNRHACTWWRPNCVR